MSVTAEEIFDRAVQRSTLNNEDLVAPAQVIQYITTFERAEFSKAAQLNPDYFGKESATAVRDKVTGVWNLSSSPGDVSVLSRAQVLTIAGTVTGVSVGTKVNLISLRWPEVDIAPRAYVRGGKITGYGTELGAADANCVTSLKLFYSPVPTGVVSLLQTLTIPDEWAVLVELKLARVLALRDRRLDELPAIDEEYKMFSNLFENAVLAYDHGVRRPLASVPAIQLPTPRQASQ